MASYQRRSKEEILKNLKKEEIKQILFPFGH